MTDLIYNFPPGYTPNEQQYYILEQIEKARRENKKYVIINAPTGVGKSFIPITLANSVPEPSENWNELVKSNALYEFEEDEIGESMAQNTSVLTMTKALQDQYYETFDEVSVLKGKANYPCNLAPYLTCDMGECMFDSKLAKMCAAKKQCEYFNKRQNSLESFCSLYNYSMFLALSGAERAKKVLVCDEASELDDVLVKNYTVEFSFSLFQKLDIDIPKTPIKGSSYQDYLTWFRSMMYEILNANDVLKSAYADLKAEDIPKTVKVKLRAIKILMDSCTKLNSSLKHTEFIIEHTTDGLIYKPYKVNHLAQNMFRNCEFVVLMSATIIDHKNFAKQLGIEEDKYHYIEASSPFDPKKAPIKFSDKISVTYKNKKETIPLLASFASKICDAHKKQKGIIHSHTMEITNELRKKLGKKARFLFRGEGINNETLMQAHIETNKPTVLISPSMTHGIDLKGELGEFAIIMKAPFLPLNDERIKRMCAEDPEWYLDKMLSSFIQMCGRTIRSVDDTSITYVLDGTIINKLGNMKDKIPKYFFDRFC